MWNPENIVAAFPQCPICGGEERILDFERAKNPGLYMSSVLESWPFESQTALDQMRAYQCSQCSTRWYDPWFEPDFVASGYGYMIGRHRYGWKSLASWVAGRTEANLDSRLAVYQLLRRMIPGLARYGEINCPFSGLLFFMARDVNPNADIADATQKKIRTLSQMFTDRELKTWYTPPTPFRQIANAAARPAGPFECHLIVEQSEICWGQSCIYSGANCRALAQDLIVDRITSFDRIETRQGHYDAIGIFNTLDHFVNPMRVLRKALKVADFVVLDLHDHETPDAQHLFNIGEGFADYLRQTGFSVLEVSKSSELTNCFALDRPVLVVSGKTDISTRMNQF